MNKLIIAVSMAVFALATTAGEVKWGCLNFYKPVATGEGPMTVTTGTKFTAAEVGSQLVFELYVVDHANADALVKLSDATVAFTADGAMSAKQLWNQDKAVEMRDTYGSSGMLDLVLKGVYSDANYDYVYVNQVQQDLRNITSGTKTYNFLGTKANAWTATAAPEPTSGLLLLLGLAGIALKRKRA